MRTTAKRTEVKAKKSYTLSPESVAYLESLRKRRRAPSTSSVLEEILQAFRRQQERVNIEESVTAYYSSLSDKEVQEQAQWGELALSEFPNES
jgi:hypothetical protein